MANDLLIRSKIEEFEEQLRTFPNQVVIADMQVNHFTTDSGLYAREMLIPAGVVIVGKIKKHDHICVVAEGRATDVTESGMQQIQAPYTMIGKAGTKRIVIAHTDVVWITIHATKETELDKIEEDLIAYSHNCIGETS